MLSIYILSILILFILSNNFRYTNDKEEIIISNFITAFLISISIIGLISMGLVFTELTRIPIILFILLLSFFYCILFRIKFKNVSNLRNHLILIYKIYGSNFKNCKTVIFLVIWLYFISFGPINHSDTITAYVGYPYQFFFQNKHFIDGGLHQGLLGVSDFANLSFFQEQTTWLIRSVQAFPIFLIVSIFILRKTDKLLIVAFLTCPVFIQWITIGKYLFLPDISITITYLVWSKFKEKKSLLNLIIVIFLSLAFKISCLIISLPIIMHIIFDTFKNKKNITFNYKENLPRIYFLTFSIFALCCILIYRLHITGNLFYPIFNNHFLSDNEQAINFEKNLRSYLRGGIFPLSILITTNFKFIGMIIGPATGFFLFTIPFIKFFRLNRNFLSQYQLVGMIQLILLLIFSQGRGDYFSSPIILIFMNEKNYINKLLAIPNSVYFKNLITKFVIKPIFYFQIFIFSCLTLMSGYQTLYGIVNYESYMNRYAYNYNLSEILNNKANEPIMSMEGISPLLFLRKDYIHEDKYNKCVNNGENNNSNLLSCIKLFKPNSVVSYSKIPDLFDEFKCSSYSAIKTARNPFRFKKRNINICKISNADY